MFQSKFSYFVILPATAVVSHQVFAADYFTTVEAQKLLFTKADSFQKLDITLTEEQVSKIKSLSGVRQRTKNPLIWKAFAKNSFLGTFMVDEVIGKHEYITYAAAISPQGEILGVEILSYRETHGGEVRENSWKKNFKGKKLTDPFRLDVDVPNITGATLSCRNILDGVKRLLVLAQLIGNG